MEHTFHAARVPIPYTEAQSLQRQLVERRLRGEVPDLLWLLEHPPTITWGSSGGEENLRRDRAELEGRGVALCRSERGGNVTFHCPGQLIGYLIVDLRADTDRDLVRFLRDVEQGLLGALAAWGLAARTIPGRTGVWLANEPQRKIAALGIRARRWISSHGFALNVENSLEGFDWIVPCGIGDAGVTSLGRELGEGAVPWERATADVSRSLGRSLGRPLEVLLGAAARERAAAEG